MVALSPDPLDLAAMVRLVEAPGHGAIVTFSGIVRASEAGSPIRAILYEAYPDMARRELDKIVNEARERWPVAAAVAHRTGRVAVCEPSLIVAVGGAHRREALEACEYVVEQIKARATIWKVEFEREAA
jgi:molybdopterin synthase catalytic subunit